MNKNEKIKKFAKTFLTIKAFISLLPVRILQNLLRLVVGRDIQSLSWLKN